MAMDYNDRPQEVDVTLDEYIHDESYAEPPFDESVLTLEQRVQVDELYKENPTLTRSDLAAMIRLNLMSHRATLEGRELTFCEISMAHDLKEVIYWVPPSQIEGKTFSTSEYHDDEDSCMPYIEEVASSFHTPMLIDECYDLICDFERLATLREEKLTRDYHEVSFDINYLCALDAHDLKFKLSIPEESRFLLEKSYLGEEFDIDSIVNEIGDPKVEIDSREENIVFYMIDGNEVDYFLINSLKPEVNFIFPPNAFDPHENLIIMEDLKTYATFVVNLLDENYVTLAWIVVCHFAYFVSYHSRRRTKCALAQPFDSHD